jgi:DNA-binding transcriptional LysR family regulator
VAVAERLSLARVAEQMHLTPSAVSFQIKQVEEQTGFALFERIGRSVALTDAGVVLLGYARVVLRSLRDADLAMLALKGLTGGRIKVGVVSTAKYIAPHMIARFRAEVPDVAVLLRDANQFFRSAGFSPRIALESSSNETIKQSVIAGMGLALISQHTISLELALGLLATLAVEDFPLMRSWFVAHRKSLPLLPIQARLRDFLVEQGQAVIDEISAGHAKLAASRR